MKPGNSPQFHTEWIERYLAGELPPEELEQFILRLQNDPAFSREVAIQRAIVEQTQRVGREDLRRQLKVMHRQMGFTESSFAGTNSTGRHTLVPETAGSAINNRAKRRFTFPVYAIAATLTLFLFATIIWYLMYRNAAAPVATPMASAVKAQTASIRLQVTGEKPAIGFSGTNADSTMNILLYPAQPAAGSIAYQFDDTLRLYGTLSASQLLLRYEADKEKYTLYIDSKSYPLQRYQPIKALP